MMMLRKGYSETISFFVVVFCHFSFVLLVKVIVMDHVVEI